MCVMRSLTTHHSYLVSNAHWYSKHSAENPDYEDDHLGSGLCYVRLQREHYSLIPCGEISLTLYFYERTQPVHGNRCQGKDAGVNTEVLYERNIKYYYNLSGQNQCNTLQKN